MNMPMRTWKSMSTTMSVPVLNIRMGLSMIALTGDHTRWNIPGHSEALHSLHINRIYRKAAVQSKRLLHSTYISVTVMVSQVQNPLCFRPPDKLLGILGACGRHYICIIFSFDFLPLTLRLSCPCTCAVSLPLELQGSFYVLCVLESYG